MAMSLEEAKKKLHQDLAKKRKGYLSENAYRQSPEGIKKGKENLVSMLEYTPAALPIEGYRAYKNLEKGNYLDAAIDAGVGVGMAVAPLAVKPIAKYGKKTYKGLKDLFSGPLSLQYNSKGALVKSFISKFFDHPLNQTVRKNKPEFKDKDIYYTGQNPAVAKQMKEGKTKGDVYFSDNPEVAKEYAGPEGIIMGFAANKPIGGKRSIIDKNMGYAGGQTQYILNPKEAVEFMKNPNFEMGFPIFSDPRLTRR